MRTVTGTADLSWSQVTAAPTGSVGMTVPVNHLYDAASVISRLGYTALQDAIPDSSIGLRDI